MAGANGLPAGLRPIGLTFEPVRIEAGRLGGLRRLGAHVLASPADGFGGFSGLEILPGRLIAIGDRGRWLTAAYSDTDRGLFPGQAWFGPLAGRDGTLEGARDGDAEGLTSGPAGLAVSFEYDHRILHLGADGLLGGRREDWRFARLESNQGLEALAALPDGRLLAIAEGPREGGFDVLLFGPGDVRHTRLRRRSAHLVTGADIGPDGRLYVVLRAFSLIAGLSARVMRYHLGPDGLPMEATGEILGDWPSATGIDNMEGISVWRDQAGRLRLALLADDNFMIFQRTLFLDFVVEE